MTGSTTSAVVMKALDRVLVLADEHKKPRYADSPRETCQTCRDARKNLHRLLANAR